jgi:hypothetical protein
MNCYGPVKVNYEIRDNGKTRIHFVAELNECDHRKLQAILHITGCTLEHLCAKIATIGLEKLTTDVQNVLGQ